MNLPAWLEPYREAWEGYLEMRRKKKYVTTDRAIKMLINKLSLFRMEGYDIEALIDEANIKNWKSFFVKRDIRDMPERLYGTNRTPESFTERNQRESRTALERVRRSLDPMVPPLARSVPKLPS